MTINKPRVLLLTDGSQSFNAEHVFDIERLNYGFTDSVSPTGFSAWWTDNQDLAVTNTAQSFSGGFAQQALNRLIMQHLMRHSYQMVVIVGLYGATLDLPRLLKMLDKPVVIMTQPNFQYQQGELERFTDMWIASSLNSADIIYAEKTTASLFANVVPVESNIDNFLSRCCTLLSEAQLPVKAYDYSLYEFGQRDHPLLTLMQEPDVGLFHGCKRVLDLGSGVGIFVFLLEQKGISAVGVERNNSIANYGREMGLNIITADAIQYSRETNENFDGIYCSHFIEHLPIELVQELLENLARMAIDGSTVVLTFPDPESIRSQLLGFWRDPEHVRFYHPDLIIAMAQSVGLGLEWSSYIDQPHDIVSFSLIPPIVLPTLQPSTLAVSMPPTLWQKILKKLGFYSSQEADILYQRINSQQQIIDHHIKQIEGLHERTNKLWDVNKTWAWNDNVVLKFRKRER